MQTFLARTGRLVALFGLSVAVCVYSLGLCFIDHHHEVPVADQARCQDCECPRHPLDTGASCEAAPCGHEHGHNAFHLHDTAPVLVPGQDKETRPEAAGLNAAAPLYLAADSSSRGMLPLQEHNARCHGIGCGIPVLSEQTLPLLL